MSHLDFSRRWDFKCFERFLQGYHEPKCGLGIIGNTYMQNYHFCPQDAPNLGFDFKLSGGGVRSFSAKSYRKLAKQLTEDKDVMLVAVQNSWGTLRYASRELKNDKDVVLAAVKRDPYAIEFASKELQRDFDVVLAAVSREGAVIRYVSEHFLDNDEIMCAAVTENGYMLRHASNRLKDDVSLVRLAVECYPIAIQHASERIRNNPSLLLPEKEDTRPAVEDAIARAMPLLGRGKREETGRDETFGGFYAR